MSSIFLFLFLMSAESSLIEKTPEKAEKRIKISSNKAIHYTETQKSILTEKVKVVDGEMTINCELMTIEKNDKKEMNLVIAEKDVIIIKGGTIATGDRAEYFIPEKKIVLTGNAKIVSINKKTGQKSTSTGAKIIFYRDKNMVEIHKFEGDAPIKDPK